MSGVQKSFWEDWNADLVRKGRARFLLSIEELVEKRTAAGELSRIETVSDRKRGTKRCRRLYKRVVRSLYGSIRDYEYNVILYTVQ